MFVPSLPLRSSPYTRALMLAFFSLHVVATGNSSAWEARAALYTILNVCHKNTAGRKLNDQSIIAAAILAPEEVNNDANQVRHFPLTLSIYRTLYVNKPSITHASEPSPYLEQKSPLSNNVSGSFKVR